MEHIRVSEQPIFIVPVHAIQKTNRVILLAVVFAMLVDALNQVIPKRSQQVTQICLIYSELLLDELFDTQRQFYLANIAKGSIVVYTAG